MFENMSEFVGHAMHDDLMMHTATRVQIAEAMGTRNPQSGRTRARTYRVRFAKALIALATRIAPAVQQQTVTAAPTATTQ